MDMRCVWFFVLLAGVFCLPFFAGLGLAHAEEVERLLLYNDWEIAEKTPLLNAEGGLAAWGWARHPHMEYQRTSIPEASLPRYKEWDYYAVMGPDFYMEITLANISWAVLASMSFVDYRTGETTSNLRLGYDADNLRLPTSPYSDVSYGTPDYRIAFGHEEKTRTLAFDLSETWLVGPAMRGEIVIQDDPREENLVTAMPFAEPGTFFYTSKMVALPASGSIDVAGKTYTFKEGETFAVLDWGRGVWPSEFTWGWAVGGGLAEGKRFGFNIGFGDEDNSRASGNSVVYDGVLHKLGKIGWTWTSDDLMQAWHFKSKDGRFDLVLEPFFDQSGEIDLGKFYAKLGKVQGRATGQVVLDDGTVVEVDGILAFAEHAVQRW